MGFFGQFFLSTLFWRPVESMKPKQAFQLYYSSHEEKKWVLRRAHEIVMLFLSHLLISKSLSNWIKRGFFLIFKLGLWLF